MVSRVIDEYSNCFILIYFLQASPCILPCILINILLMQIKDGRLTSTEIKNISRAIESDVEDLMEEMEMEYSLKRAKTARNPRMGLAHIVISDFAAEKDGNRYKLAQLLNSAGFFDVAEK